MRRFEVSVTGLKYFQIIIFNFNLLFPHGNFTRIRIGAQTFCYKSKFLNLATLCVLQSPLWPSISRARRSFMAGKGAARPARARRAGRADDLFWRRRAPQVAACAIRGQVAARERGPGAAGGSYILSGGHAGV
jgi:hypothetical protein